VKLKRLATLISLITIIYVFLVGCTKSAPLSQTSTYIVVIDKYSEGNKNWILAKDTSDQEIRLEVDSKNTWNLIEQKMYLAVYEYDNKSKKGIISSISHPSHNVSK
jgi:hypothetical protein